jgi:glucokinase
MAFNAFKYIRISSMNSTFDTIVLAGDIGGTNVNLALVGKNGEKFSIIHKRNYGSQKVTTILDPLKDFLAETGRSHGALKPTLCCISGAGPVKNGYCSMSNVPWGIDRAEVESFLGLPTVLINDFTAISYGICQLDIDDAAQITKVPHSDGSIPSPLESPKAVVGAGTGLGVGYLVKGGGKWIACASEGGHSDFASVDAESDAFNAWLRRREGIHVGSELAVSGQGIANIFDFLADSGTFGPTKEVARIAALADEEKPAAVAAASHGDPLCDHAMDLFVKLYARFAANATTYFYPKGGIYLAGGIVTKNEARFLKNGLFIRTYEENYKEQIVDLLRGTPVYIVKDYSISLYGAAYAAINLR